MRRKINFQQSEYVQDGEVVCFGVSEHFFEEARHKWTDKAQKDLNVLSTWFKRGHWDDVATRPVYRSDFNWTSYHTRAQLRVLLGLAFIRELPIRNFYVRCWIAYAYIIFFVIRGIGRGMSIARPIVMYNNAIHAKALANYPDLYWWQMSRKLPKATPTPDVHREWQTRQMPVYHQYHKTAYRYRNRKPRYVPWDGTMNQPVMPYLHDDGTDVINGTFKRNCNSAPHLH